MFDLSSDDTDAINGLLDRVRSLFRDHVDDLAEASSLLGGGTAAAKVVACAVRVKTARQLDRRVVRDLEAIHRVLSLEHVGDPDRLETGLFAELHPASAVVDAICRLTEMLEDVLREIRAAERRAAARGGLHSAD